MLTTEVPVKDTQKLQSSSKSNSQHDYAYEEEGIAASIEDISIGTQEELHGRGLGRPLLRPRPYFFDGENPSTKFNPYKIEEVDLILLLYLNLVLVLIPCRRKFLHQHEHVLQQCSLAALCIRYSTKLIVQ